MEAYGFVHVHTEYSLNDAPATISELCEAASGMGAHALTITDHGNCAGWDEFRRVAAAHGLRPVFGVEGYVATDWVPHAHILLLGKNANGLRCISRAISRAAMRAQTIGGILQPVLTKAILEEECGTGDVIATTACIAGIAAGPMNANARTMSEIARRRRMRDRYPAPNDPEYLKDLAMESDLNAEIAKLRERRDEVRKAAERSCAKDEIRIAAMRKARVSNLEEQEAALAEKKAAIAEAASELDMLKRHIAAAVAKRGTVRSRLSKFREQQKRRAPHEEAINKLQTALLSQAEITAAMDAELEWMLGVFGAGNVFAEMQYHGLEQEAAFYPELADRAAK